MKWLIKEENEVKVGNDREKMFAGIVLSFNAMAIIMMTVYFKVDNEGLFYMAGAIFAAGTLIGIGAKLTFFAIKQKEKWQQRRAARKEAYARELRIKREEFRKIELRAEKAEVRITEAEKRTAEVEGKATEVEKRLSEAIKSEEAMKAAYDNLVKKLKWVTRLEKPVLERAIADAIQKRFGEEPFSKEELEEMVARIVEEKVRNMGVTMDKVAEKPAEGEELCAVEPENEVEHPSNWGEMTVKERIAWMEKNKWFEDFWKKKG